MGGDAVNDLLAYLGASPTPFHAVREAARRLEARGYAWLDEADVWSLDPGTRGYVIRGDASLIAFELGREPVADAGFRLIGAHTDSPNLRIKPNPEHKRAGYEQLGVEAYGGVLWHTWLDRDLSLAGRVVAANGDRQLVDFKKPLLRVPSLAIHLNRKVNKEGLKLNAQKHLAPMLALSDSGSVDLRELLAGELDGIEASDIFGWDLCAYDVQGPALSGIHGEFIHSARLDNLASCHAALRALSGASGDIDATRVIVLYDHEEVGSRSAQGAASSFLRMCLERLSGNLESFSRAMARSFFVSADMAHAVHPNYPDRHEPEHQPVLGRGPVIKVNSNQSYATDGEAWARFEKWARQADVPTQRFVVRSDMGCGSTIGPITAAELGIRTVDVGNPMLSMHSCREMAAGADVPAMIKVLKHFLTE